MKNFNRILLILVICYSVFSAVIFVRVLHAYPFFYQTSGKWKLVWEDNFNGSVLDQTKWETTMRSINPLKELQAYTYENVTVKNGYLIIASRQEDWTGPNYINPGLAVTKHYTSGEVKTANDGVWTYGRFEIRAKLPAGQGLLSYILLYPTDDNWPPEIDMMICVGHQPEVVYFNNTWGTDARHYNSDDSGPLPGADYSTDFHTFALEWEPRRLRWYIDDILKYQLDRNIPNRPLCLIIGTSIGGIYSGDPYDQIFAGRPSSFPQYFMIDRVRVLQRR